MVTEESDFSIKRDNFSYIDGIEKESQSGKQLPDLSMVLEG